METEGTLSPESLATARAAFESAGPTAKQVVREAAKAMAFDREEYRERVTGEVVERARNVLFADQLAVTVGSRAEFDAWVDEHPDYEVITLGSDDVDRVAWHAAPFAETAVAATFQNEREAAVGTLRKQAFSRLYRPEFEVDSDGSSTDDDSQTSDTDSETSDSGNEADSSTETNGPE
ncbi:DUF5809 family protein [Halobellus sp. H-GB7]|uniref:DUF5809 family protein n=1 Tax=Halobellus sp. H-GB7 TaxID=3069756 RepID=UPI0027B1BC45|nr:DUF5809 family protein [Halobellus sp. H-GB7]MDQ2054970.1 DUF5809 family protein [Halobellus sp. H-GB7]